jgi:patatin-related protein
VREKELRLALVCYGGVSLAIYMHGIAKETWKLLRASKAFHAGTPSSDGLKGSELVWYQLLQDLSPHVALRVMVDIIAGASAGGINGIQLAHAISGGHDMEPLRDMWLNHADVEMLLDERAVRGSFITHLFAGPLVWFLSRRKADPELMGIRDPAVRAEVTGKLRRFVRSRWFEPPFSGTGFTRILFRALGSMETGTGTGPLLPPDQPLDLFVTVTDFHGYAETLPLHSPPQIVETEHRLVIGFRDDGGDRRNLASAAALTFAARATASFPGAFPPFQPMELDTVLASEGSDWPGRDSFLARIFPRRIATGLDPATAVLIDGSVLNNRPFGPAIEALGRRPAHREVDRRFVYIDPKPGGHLVGVRSGPGTAPPGFFRTILRALSDIPREQPIRDSVEALNDLSVRARRLAYIVAAMRGSVDAAIERALGRTLIMFKITPDRLTGWRNKVHNAAVAEAGFAYPAYAHLKLSQVVEAVIARIGEPDGFRRSLWHWIKANRVDAVTEKGAATPYVTFLKRFDLQYRIRRLRFLIRRTNELIPDADDETRAALERAKTGLYAMLSPYLEHRAADLQFAVDLDVAVVLDQVDAGLGLTALDSGTDAALVALLNDAGLTKAVRRALVLAYLGFPFFDIATLPLLQGDAADEFDEIKVDRISPDDAPSLGVGMLKGIKFNAFGGFFSRAWRENDYLLGRLHAVERLTDIVISALPANSSLADGTASRIKRAGFKAVLDEERPHLTHIPELFALLERRISDS